MIVGYIKGQSFSLSSPTIASGTIDHLTAVFTFLSSEWEQCNEIWVHFSQGDTVYDAEIIEGKVNKDQHINLDKGEWEVYVHGNVTANGEVVERITTEKETLFVQESGIFDGNPFPSVEESTAEKILAKAQFAVDEIGRLEDKIEESAISPEQEAQIQSNTAMIEDILLNGRNLLKNGDLSSREGWLTSGLSLKFDNGYMEISKAETSGRANFYQSASQNPLLNKSENAEMYTISIEVMKISGVEIPANSSFEIHFGGTTKRLIANIPTDLNEGVWTKIKATTPTNFEPSGNMVARISVGKNAGGFACRNAKLESWTTALESLNKKIDDMPTGGGLTPEQKAEIQANTEARHTHENKDTLDKLGESGEILTYDGKKVVDSSVLAVVKEQKQLESLSDKSLLCYVLTDRIGFTPMTLEAGVVYGGLADYKDREPIYIDPLLQNFFPCSAFTVTTEKVLLEEGTNRYCHYEFSTDGATYFYFNYFVNDEPFWVRLYNATDDMLIVDGVTFPVGWSQYSVGDTEVAEIPIFTDSDYYMYFDVHSLKFSNDDYFNELQNVFSAERTYGSVRGYYQYYNSKWQKINFVQISINSNSAAESISANAAAIESLQKQFTAFEGEVTEIEAMIDESGVLDE